MSNLATHEAEQAAITATCEADGPSPCERAQQIMDETDGENTNNARRAAGSLLALDPSFDDIETACITTLSNMLHLCDLAGFDFKYLLRLAKLSHKTHVKWCGIAADDALRLAIERN